jgi:DNA polymerase III subunit epsilon
MILMGFDMETTGLDIQNDQPIEIGMLLYSTAQKRSLESAGFLVKTDVAISPFITGLTGVTKAATLKFGYESHDALETVIDMMNSADAIVGQNVIRFDKRMIQAWAARESLALPEKLWIDTRTDLPGVESKSLTYMAADHGFLNLFPHGALTDVQTCIKIVSMYDIDVVVARAKEPTVILKAHVGFENNSLAKARKFGWYDDKAGTKFWYKVVKQSDVAAETSHGEFDISFITDVPVEKLWYS